jgi:thiol:disulfide interchange protein DsbD
MVRRVVALALVLLASLACLPRAFAQLPSLDTTDRLKLDVSVTAGDPFDPKNEMKSNGKLTVRRGQTVRVQVAGNFLQKGYHTYPVTKRASDQLEAQLSEWKVEPVAGIVPIWPILETEPKLVKNLLGELELEHEDDFSWSQELLVEPDAKPGPTQVPIAVRVQVCNKGGCQWDDRKLTAEFMVSDEPPVSVSDDLRTRAAVARPPIAVVKTGKDPKSAPSTGAAPDRAAGPSRGDAGAIIGPITATQQEYQEQMEALAARVVHTSSVTQTDADLLGFLLAGIFWGAVSLVTPCVFPMIPITVSFFLKQSEKEHHRPIWMASIYCLTIVVVLTLAAAFLLTLFRELSILPVTNYFLGGLFIFFALSLFGMYEIELPGFLARMTSSREGQGGVAGTIFMALTFTIISFACVAPFLGGFGGTAASERPLWHNLLGGLAFSATFAAPFFVLALFPSLLRAMPKSGSWLNSVKVVMGFLELAAAFKFLRSAELVLSGGVPTIFTFDFVLGIWIALCFLCGIYLIGVYHLPHDTPSENIGVPRMLFSAVFLALALYLLPALFKVDHAGAAQRPRGTIYAWIDSFLLPEAREGSEVPSTANLEFAVNHAIESRKETGVPKRIFIDFTGVTCTNCNLNEMHVFSKPGVQRLFEPYTVVKLYTDTVPERYYSPEIKATLAKSDRQVVDAKHVNGTFQSRVFSTRQLPLYVILEPQTDGQLLVTGVYEEGLINNESRFMEFLREGK